MKRYRLFLKGNQLIITFKAEDDFDITTRDQSHFTKVISEDGTPYTIRTSDIVAVALVKSE
jgi:hypothetical protein